MIDHTQPTGDELLEAHDQLGRVKEELLEICDHPGVEGTGGVAENVDTALSEINRAKMRLRRPFVLGEVDDDR